MHRYINSSILIISFFVTNLAIATGDLPNAFEAEFSLYTKGAKVAKMKRSLSLLENGQFLYRSETYITGLLSLFKKDHIIEQSTWYLHEKQIRPLLYSYEHTGGKKDRNVIIHFDWSSKQITNSINGASWSMQTQPDIMDKLLYQLAIMHDLKVGKEQLAYTIADGGKIKIYNFTMLGEEIIKTPIGNLHTLKLERQRPDSRRKTTLWCAQELKFLPVKVENIETDGRKTTAIINSLSGIDY